MFKNYLEIMPTALSRIQDTSKLGDSIYICFFLFDWFFRCTVGFLPN